MFLVKTGDSTEQSSPIGEGCLDQYDDKGKSAFDGLSGSSFKMDCGAMEYRNPLMGA